MIRARLRHRALLNVLESAHELDISQYVGEYEQEEEKSFAALADILLLNNTDFPSRHHDWVERERDRFRLSGTKPQPRIELTPMSENPSESPSNENADKKPRLRRNENL